MAILNVIIGEDLYDHDFVENWCSGFEQLSEHVEQFPPSWAAEVTGLPEEQIIEVARLMGTVKPTGIIMGNGIGDQSNDGHWTVACICLIEAITGNLGIAGGGGAGMVMPDLLIKTKPMDPLADRMPASAEDEENGWMPGVSKLVAPETPRWFQNKMTQESGPTSAYNRGLMSILSEEPGNDNAQALPARVLRHPQELIELLRAGGQGVLNGIPHKYYEIGRASCRERV